jgi:chlorosome envelope protein X
VKRAFETNPLQLTEYAAKMGWESLVQFPETMRLQATRDFDLWQLISDVISGIGDALQLIANAFLPVWSTQGEGEGTKSSGTCKPLQLSAYCNGNAEKNSSPEREHIAA